MTREEAFINVPGVNKPVNCPKCGRDVWDVAYKIRDAAYNVYTLEPSPEALELGVGLKEPTTYYYCGDCGLEAYKEFDREYKLKLAKKQSREFVGLRGYLSI